jgi:hypothetical protein
MRREEGCVNGVHHRLHALAIRRRAGGEVKIETIILLMLILDAVLTGTVIVFWWRADRRSTKPRPITDHDKRWLAMKEREVTVQEWVMKREDEATAKMQKALEARDE